MSEYRRREVSVEAARSRIFAQRKRALEKTLQDAMTRRCQVEARIMQHEAELTSLDMQINGIKAQIIEIEKEI